MLDLTCSELLSRFKIRTALSGDNQWLLKTSQLGALAALASPTGKAAFLTEPGREGDFEFQAGNFTARVASDSLQGLYVASTVVAVSAGAWVRVWDGNHGRPEWFGAQVNNAGFDSLPALNACTTLCPTVMLPAGALYVSNSWVIQQDNRTIQGVKKSWIGYTDSTSQIILTGANATTADVMIVGYSYTGPVPGNLDGFCKQTRLSCFDVARTVPAVCPAAGVELQAPCGIRFMHTWHTEVDHVNSIDNPIGFLWAANVYCFADRLTYRKSTANAPGAGDYAFGYFVDGNYRIGVFGAGGNASLYFSESKAQIETLPSGNAMGFSINGGYSDIWITKFETIGCKTGMSIVGYKDVEDLTPTSVSPSSRSTNNDLHILQPIIDQPSNLGIEISKIVRYGTVEIVDPYVAIGTATSAIYAHDGNGQVKIMGGHCYGWPNETNGVGVYGVNQSGLWAQGLTLIGFKRPVVLNNCFSPHIELPIINPYETTGGPAIDLTSVTNGFVGCHVTGGPSGLPFAIGVKMNGTACTKTEVRGTGMDQGAITGAKLQYNGTTVSTASFGTGNIFSGVTI